MALLQALGAERGTVFGVVLLETAVTVLLGVGLSSLVSVLGGQLLGNRIGFALPAPVLTWTLLLRVAALFPQHR